jgi:hypothetical protein
VRATWLLRASVGLTLLPLAISAVHLLVVERRYVPIGDLAMTELLTRDVGRHWVELGPYSRDGWFHPGPAMFYVLAVPYRLLGSSAAAMDAGALAVNAAAVAGIAAIARRLGGVRAAVIALVGCALLMRSLGPDELRLPWNPYVTVLPYLLLVFLTWAMVGGERWALPAAVVVASFVAQSHIGYVLLAVPLVAAGAGWMLATALVAVRRDRSDPALRRLVVPAAVAVGIGVLVWLPPLVEQIVVDPGNLTRALDWMGEGGPRGERPAGWLTGWRLVSAQYGLPPEWLFGQRPVNIVSEPHYLYEPIAPVLLVVVAVAVHRLWRWGVRPALRLAAVLLLASALGVVAGARIVGPVFEYRIGWSRALGAVSGMVVAWAGAEALARRRPSAARRLAVPAAVAALAVLAVVGAVAHVRVDLPEAEREARLSAVLPDVLDAIAEIPEGDGPVVIDGRTTFDAGAYAPALVLELERRGIDARLAGRPAVVGEHRAYDGGPRRAHLLIDTGERIAWTAARDDTRLVARDGDADGRDAGGTEPLAVFLVEPSDDGS